MVAVLTVVAKIRKGGSKTRRYNVHGAAMVLGALFKEQFLRLAHLNINVRVLHSVPVLLALLKSH
jgi:hypothetical protein